jgi:histidinol-phosphate/aromatic aminotransferase/cobyric acid decarboxylase-like protein
MGIKNTLPNLKDKPYGGAWSIHDTETLQYVNKSVRALAKPDVKRFLNDYAHWFKLGHTIEGIDKFVHLAPANGTTEVFDKFYMQNTHRRLRLWKGEYFYHQIVARENFYNRFAWIEDEPIAEMDVVVVSLPFANTGKIPENFDQIMQLCDSKNVNVLIDMAYVNISQPIKVDLSYNCIKVIATSLSKVFPVETYRIGMRLMKDYLDDSLQAYVDQATPYVNMNSIHLGQQLIEEYSNRYIVNKYAQLQKHYCDQLGVTPSPCVIFGIDENNQYPEYARGGKTNRLCFSKIWDGRVAT